MRTKERKILPRIPREIEEFVKTKMQETMEQYGTYFDSRITDEVLEREVFAFGNSGRVSIPKKHVGRKVRVFILKQNLQEEKEADKE